MGIDIYAQWRGQTDEAKGKQTEAWLSTGAGGAGYSLRAKYPLRVQTPRSTVYEYYQPQNRAESEPVTLRVADN